MLPEEFGCGGALRMQDWILDMRHDRLSQSKRGLHMMRRRGLTLIEILVAVAIIAVLAGLLLVAGSTVQKSFRTTQAKTQFAVLANAIEQYTQAWKPWVAPSGAKLADKGLPDWSGWRLFPQNGDIYDPLGGSQFQSDDINNPAMTELDFDNDDTGNDADIIDIELAAECLGYCLTAPVNGGPFLKDLPQGMANVHDDEFYPERTGTGAQIRRFELIDPWGRLLRYFWVARDSQAPLGYRAVFSADYRLLPGGGINNPQDNGPRIAKAVGYVIESAGPDGKFGNQWKRAPNAEQIADAQDNIVIKP